MKIKVGNYEVYGEFNSESEAREVFLAHFPAVTPEDLDRALKGKKFSNENKSGNAAEKATKSKGTDAKTGEKVTGEK